MPDDSLVFFRRRSIVGIDLRSQTVTPPTDYLISNDVLLFDANTRTERVLARDLRGDIYCVKVAAGGRYVALDNSCYL